MFSKTLQFRGRGRAASKWWTEHCDRSMCANREGECPDKEWREWRDHIRSDALFVSKGALFMSLNLGSLRSTFSFQFTEEGTKAQKKKKKSSLAQSDMPSQRERQDLNSRCLNSESRLLTTIL